MNQRFGSPRRFDNFVCIGRRRELRFASDLLNQAGRKIIIHITGLPGIGKTTLAQAITREQQDTFDCAFITLGEAPYHKAHDAFYEDFIAPVPIAEADRDLLVVLNGSDSQSAASLTSWFDGL